MTINDMFAELLVTYMRRIRASAAGVAAEIGLSREAVNNWRNGYSRPSKRHRDKLLACADYLRLTEEETNGLLQAAGFAPEFLAADSGSPVLERHAGQLIGRLQGLGSYPILLILSQASWGQLPLRDELLAQARQSYGAHQVLHIQPPYSLSTQAGEYFGALGVQCEFGSTDSDFAFEGALLSRLRETGPLFLMVSRFEQGVTELRNQLAGILRSLSEEHPGRLHLALCGGQQLAELKYAGGDLSLLNIAEVELWPELSTEDVAQLARANTRRPVDSATAAAIHRACGGHSGLVSICLDWIATDQAPADNRWETALTGHDQLWAVMVSLIGEAATRERLTALCAEDQIGPARPYLVDPLLRALYWRNLITNRDGAERDILQWRCAAIRNTMRQVLDEWPAQC